MFSGGKAKLKVSIGTLNGMKHVLCHWHVVVGLKAKSFVDKTFFEGWDRILYCQVNNTDNVSYLLDLRVVWLVKYNEC